MKRRKPETCLSGQAKISKYFCHPVVVLKGNSSPSGDELCVKKIVKTSKVKKNAGKSKQAEAFVANVAVLNSRECQEAEKTSKDITDTNVVPRDVLADIHHLSYFKDEANNKIDTSGQCSISSVCSNHTSREERSPSDANKYYSSSDEERTSKRLGVNKPRSTSSKKALDPQSKLLSELAQVKENATEETQYIFRQERNGGLCMETSQPLDHPGNSILFKSSDDLMVKVPVSSANLKHEKKSNTKKCPENDPEQCKLSISEQQDNEHIAVETFEDLLFDEWDLLQGDLDKVDNDYNLQLDSAKRCKVIRSIDGPRNNEKTLVVSSTENNEVAKCVIRGIWATSCRTAPGDVVRLKCNKYDKIEKFWILDDDTSGYPNATEPIGSPINQLGHLIEFPDMLISGTSVVGSLFCPRKSVLSDRFRGFESCCPPPLLLNNPTMTNNSTSDSGNSDSQPKAQNSARIMLIGSLVHELLQKSLSGNLNKQFDIGKVCHEILHDKKTAGEMYAAQVNLCDIRKEVMDFIPKISHFMLRFVETCDQVNTSSNCGKWGRGENVDEAREWNGKICEVKDIEENLWVPSLGLKGKVDVTVMVKIHPKSQRGTKDNVKEMPLELKTGRNTYSPEHQGQVLLYCMMMSALAATKDTPSHAINSGLLLYLREESMREVVLGKHTERDLIILRNNLAYYLGRGPGFVEDGCSTINGSPISSASKLPQLSLPDLPEPINHRKACSNCPYLTICAAHLNRDKSSECISKNHPMSLLVPQALKHLKSAHLDFFVHWSCLVSLENQECQKEMDDYFIWTKKPHEREKCGKSICHLVVVAVKFVSRKGSESGGEVPAEGYFHHMVRNNEFHKTFSPAKESPSTGCLSTSTFGTGERVLISSNSRVAISSGTVVSLTEDVLCVCCDRDLTVRYGNGDFHVDKYDYASSSSSFCLTSLGLLLEDNWSAARLRELVIDKREPKYSNKLDGKMILKCSSALKGLNKPQARAVLRSLSANDYLLVRGLPGTGKTTTIVKMVQAFVLMGRSVLLTGHTHSSVDSVMLKLVKLGLGDSLIRLGGSLTKMDAELWQYSESTLTMDACSPQDLERIYQSKAIVGTTCMGCGHPLLSNRAFDVCILDEAGQVLLPISLRPILSCKVFVLVGDPDQLPPVVRGHRARLMGLDQTLFNVLDSHEACVTLDVQHRMNSVITKLANDLSYGSQLICANDRVANSTAVIPKFKELMDLYLNESWLSTVISPEINYSVVFIDTGNTLHLIDKEFYPNERKKMGISSNAGRDNAHKYSNICEAAIVFYIVKALLRGGVGGGSIGVITPYSEQVSLLKSILSNVGSGISEEDGKVMLDVNTVDQFQGKDKEIIIYSFTRSGNVNDDNSKPKEHELMSNKSRLTVAVTRAKHKLICIGDTEKLKTYAILKEFISHIPENNLISLSNDECGFNWSKVFHSMKNIS